jgi:uncharacterized protein (UPF0276 family)
VAAPRPGPSAAVELPARCGIGLRPAHFARLLDERTDVPFFEILAENHLQPCDPAAHVLEALRSRAPLTLHSVGMSLGSSDPLDLAHLGRLRELAERLEPALVSDHLAWVSLDGRQFHDLLPLPFLEEAVVHVAERVARVQDLLGRRIALENVSSHALRRVGARRMEFLAAVADARTPRSCST